MGEGMTGGDSGGDGGAAPPTHQKSRYELVKADLKELLEENVTYDGWAHQTAKQKKFYVRGFTWFKDNVLRPGDFITGCDAYIPRMREIVAERPAWIALPFPWDEKFGWRQFVDAASVQTKQTPMFFKAAQIITLCEAWTEALHAIDEKRPSPADLYNHMRIEAAVSRVHGFDRPLVDSLSNENTDLLLAWTGQQSLLVFYDMADGKTVTNKLARWTLNFVREHLPTVKVGKVDVTFNPNRAYAPSKNEFIDVKQRNLPVEARTALAKNHLS